jgi:hypothetical protein
MGVDQELQLKGILWIEDVSLVYQSIDNCIFVKSSMPNKELLVHRGFLRTVHSMLSLRHFPFPRALYYPCFIQARQLVWPQGYGSTLSAECSFVNGTELTISNAAIQHFSCLKVML